MNTLRSAFTLLELLIVLAVIGITLGAVGPAFALRRSAISDDATGAVTRILNDARQTALKSASDATVTFDPTIHRAWVRALGATPPLDTTFAANLPGDVELSSNVARPRFHFESNGRASGDQLIIATAQARSAITADPYSGDIRVRSVGAETKANARR